MLGYAKAALAGGTESMSMVPMGGNKIAPNPWIVANYPDVYLTTGLVAENHARASNISREAQDEFSLRSHQRAIAAQNAGKFLEEIVPVSALSASPREHAVGHGARISLAAARRGSRGRRLSP